MTRKRGKTLTLEEGNEEAKGEEGSPSLHGELSGSEGREDDKLERKPDVDTDLLADHLAGEERTDVSFPLTGERQ